MTYNIYSLYYKIAVKIKGWTFLPLIYYFARNFQFIDINFRIIAYVYLLREPYIVTTNEGKSTENFWRVISKSIKSNTILFFSCSFPFTSIIQPLEKCHSICKPNNLRTHCSAKNWSNVNTMSFFREFTVDGCNENGITSGPKCFEWLGFHKLSESIPNTSGKGRKNRKFRWHGSG